MKAIHIVASIHREASGPSYSVPSLCQALAEAGSEVELHVNLGDRPDNARYAVRRHGRWPWPARLGVSNRMLATLAVRARSAQVMHNHGLWMMPNVYPSLAVRGTACKLVVSPRGTLSPWALKGSRLTKAVAWRLVQGPALERADCLHATSSEEHRDIRARGLTAPVAVIPNGIDLPPARAGANGRAAEGGRRRLLFLGRIDPIKGVDILIRAWALVQTDFPGWELVIVGPSSKGYSESLVDLGRSLGCERVVFPGPAYGAKKREAYLSSSLFVLPSHTENFGMAVAEALAHGLPAIVSNRAPWAKLEQEGCGWWIDVVPESLAAALREAMALSPEEQSELGARGRAWMARDFSWERIGAMMLDTYRFILGQCGRPEWVHVY